MSFISRFRRSTGRVIGRKDRAGLHWRKMWPLWLICGALVVVTVAGAAWMIREDRALRDDTPETKLQAGQDLRMAIDHLVIGRLYLFSYPGDQGRHIRFVVRRTSDGAVHANMASCQACYRSEHPHFTRKGQVICGMCNDPMHRPEENGLTAEQKQCALVSLPYSTRDNELVVSAQSLLEKSREMEAQ